MQASITSQGLTNIKMNGKQVFVINFKVVKPKDGATVYQVRDLLTNVSRKLHEDGLTGICYSNLFFKEYEVWRTGKKSRIGQRVEVFLGEGNYEDNVDFTEKLVSLFTLVFYQDNARAGGNRDQDTNCLWYCIKSFYNNNANNLPYKIALPIRMREHCGLDATALFPIDKLDQVAKLAKINISVEGDHTYLTKTEFAKTMKLKLEDSHYTLITKDKIRVRGRTIKTKDVLLVACYKQKNGFSTCFEDSEKKFITKQEYWAIKCDTKNDYKIIDVDHEPTKQDLRNYRKLAFELSERTKEMSYQLDILQNGNNFPQIARNIFNRLQKEQFETEEIDQMEYSFLSQCSGALMNHTKYEGTAYAYDINASYPNEMAKNENTFPITKPKYYKLTNEDINPKFYKYGIYRAIVKKSDTNKDKLFRFNKNNHYTHIDLTVARDLGLEIELIIDDEFNAMLYETKRRTGKHLFGYAVEYLYELSKDQNLSEEARKFMKLVRSSFWGSLCRKRFQFKKEVDGFIELNGSHDIEKIAGDLSYVICYDSTKCYETDYARLGPFLLSMGKRAIYKIYKDNDIDLDDIVRIQTDEIIVKQELPNAKVSNNIGELKLKQGHFKIEGVNKVIYNKE